LSIITDVTIFQQATLTPEGPRDPLGTWGARRGVTGDASGNVIQVSVNVPAAIKAAYVYTCYSVNISKLTGTNAIKVVKARLLTNWPNVDPQAGVQAYGSLRMGTTRGSSSFAAPITGIDGDLIADKDRFILLYDPRAIGTDMTIVELGIEDNILNDTYSFEAYGYFWDRSVMDTPGGPRHPGSA